MVELRMLVVLLAVGVVGLAVVVIIGTAVMIGVVISVGRTVVGVEVVVVVVR